MKSERPSPLRNAARRVFGALLIAFGAFLLLGVLLDLAHGDFGSGSDAAGLIFVLLLDMLVITSGVLLLRDRARTAHLPATAYPPPGTYPPPSYSGTAGSPSPTVPTMPTEPPTEPPQRRVDRSVRHLQLCCQLPFVRTVVALVLSVGGYWLVLLVPDIGGNGPQGFLFLPPALPAFYLLGVLLFLPYRIRVRDGVLTCGVVGVPRIGRLWRSVAVDLADVGQWDIALQPRMHRPRRRPAGSQRTPRPVNVNAMVGPGGRYCLTVSAPQAALQGRAYPNMIMTGYVAQPSTALDLREGPLVIRTRRPHALRAALQRALPNLPSNPPPTGQ